MIKKIGAILAAVTMALSLMVVPVVMTSQASAEINIGNCVKQGSDGNGNLTGDCTGDAAAGPAKGTDLSDIIKFVVNTISIIVGFIAVLMLIWGGVKYITSGGESNKITSAKNTIIYALIGLVIVALAQFIVQFVLSKAASQV